MIRLVPIQHRLIGLAAISVSQTRCDMCSEKFNIGVFDALRLVKRQNASVLVFGSDKPMRHSVKVSW